MNGLYCIHKYTLNWHDVSDLDQYPDRIQITTSISDYLQRSVLIDKATI